MKEIIVIDDFLSEEDHHKIYDLTMKRKWNPVNDEENNPLSGYSGYNSSDKFSEQGTQIVLNECMNHKNLVSIIKTKYVQSLYNKYDPKTPTYFHVDSEKGGWTLIYFPDTTEYNYQMGGETQILVDNQIVGVLPLPNRLMAFEGSLNHKGTSFTNDQARYSLAIQFRD